MEYIDVIGYIAAFVTNISMYPQAVDISKNSNLHTINPFSFLIQSIGCGLWIWYGVEAQTYPIIVGGSMALIPNSYITYKSIIYRYNRSRVDNINMRSIVPHHDESGNHVSTCTGNERAVAMSELI